MTVDMEKRDAILKLVRQRFPQWTAFNDPEFERQEVTYKHETISKARERLNREELDRLIAQEEFEEVIERIQAIGRDNNLLWRSVPTAGDLKILYIPNLDKGKFCRAFFDLIYGPGSSVERFSRYLEYVRMGGLPNYWTFPTYFLFICHPEEEIFVKPTPISWFLKFVGAEIFSKGPRSESYDAIKKLAHNLKDMFVEFGPRDMVDIQSLIWVCYSVSERDNEPERHYWVEKTLVEGVPYKTGDNGLGQALCSPQESVDGKDIYANMRRVKAGDVVFHLVDNEALAGVSLASSEADDAFVGPKDTDWTDKPGYRIQLEDFTELQPPIARVEFFEDPAHKIELRKILSKNKNLFFNRELKLNQGAYLTKAPQELVELWNRIYFSKTGHGLPHVKEGFVSPNRTWIFQANPEFYDLRQAINDLNQDTWLALEHKGDIHTGDRAYLWTSGPEAGIVAVAEILDEVSERPIAEQSRPYVKEPGKFLGVQPRVSVRIVKTVDPTLMRKDLLSYPELKDLSILKQPGTNFPVTASESQFIDHLISSRSSLENSPTDRVIQWVRNIRTQASPDGRFYYKPLVLLALLSLMDKEQDHGESFSYGELFSEYRNVATELGLVITEDQFSQPYLRLRNDIEPLRVWLPLGNGNDFEDEKSDQPQYVRSNCPYIKIAGSVWPVFQSIERREDIRREILKRWPLERAYTIKEAIEDLFIQQERFEEILALFKAKKNLILQGPPGVGKSFFAKRLAYGLIGFKANERIKMIQFHQSYTYEDFIQGYRPTQDWFIYT